MGYLTEFTLRIILKLTQYHQKATPGCTVQMEKLRGSCNHFF